MAARSITAPSFPRRDADGRISSLPEMLGGVFFGLMLCLVVLLAIDGVFAALGVGRFGTISGWLAGILVVWMFVEEFRAWRAVPARLAVAVLAGAVALISGIGISALLTALPAVFNGSISVAIAGAVYAVLWFFGIRYLASRFGER